VGVTTYWTFVCIACVFFFLTQVLSVGIQFALREALHQRASTDNMAQGSNYIAMVITNSVFAVYLASLRQRFRKNLGGRGNQTAMDCLCYWCCPWCIVCQNARQIDGIQNINVQCCCRVVKLGEYGSAQQQQMVVGQVVTGQVATGQVVTQQQPVGGKVV